MSILTAYYNFQLILVKAEGNHRYVLKKLKKAHNNFYFNELFSVTETVKFRSLSPKDINDDYVLYPLQFKNNKGEERALLFESAIFLHPFGVVNITDSQDCILFQLSPDNLFEVYISEGNGNMAAQLLTMLVDGSMKYEINMLLTLVDGNLDDEINEIAQNYTF